jgi:type III secretory pathway lipoprotein EscJ
MTGPMVQVALAESVSEAEEIQALLSEAGIDSQLETAVDTHPRAVDDAPQKVLVPEDSLEDAMDAIESLTEPDEPPADVT